MYFLTYLKSSEISSLRKAISCGGITWLRLVLNEIEIPQTSYFLMFSKVSLQLLLTSSNMFLEHSAVCMNVL